MKNKVKFLEKKDQIMICNPSTNDNISLRLFCDNREM